MYRFWSSHFILFLKCISVELLPFQVVSTWHSLWRSNSSPSSPWESKADTQGGTNPHLRPILPLHFSSSCVHVNHVFVECSVGEICKHDFFVVHNWGTWHPWSLRHPFIILGHDAGYLRKLRCASLSKLSKSMESYLLLVESGSKSSEIESGGPKKR